MTVGGDKGFDTRGFVAECRNLGVTPTSAQNHARPGAEARLMAAPHATLDMRSAKEEEKRIEECAGWLKTIALMRKVRHRGVCKVDWIFSLARPTIWCACETWRPQFQGCKSESTCVSRSIELEATVTKTPEIEPIDIINDEQ